MISALSDVYTIALIGFRSFLTSGVVSKPARMPGDERFRCPRLLPCTESFRHTLPAQRPVLPALTE